MAMIQPKKFQNIFEQAKFNQKMKKPMQDDSMKMDIVPEESNVRKGAAEVTGKICVIGSKLNEDNLKALFSK